ncbi:MAG: DMT family transporter, partial [bacterium]|nr:DMT family transporter [bacterium]
VMGFNWVFLFEAYKYTTVSMATVSYYCAPVIITVLSPLVLGEKLTAARIAGIAAATAGMFMITGSLQGGSQPLKGVLFGLLAALFYACVTLLNKKLKGSFTGIQITMIQLLAAGLVVTPYAVANHQGAWVMPQGAGLVCLIIVGVVHTGIVLHLYFSSMQILPGQSVAMCSYIDPVSSLLIAAAGLSERMSIVQIIGAFLIIGGAAFGELYRKKE